MHHDRRARPTVRLLLEDLTKGWADPASQRLVESSNWVHLHPFADLNHPLIRKAAELYGSAPTHDPAPQFVGASGSLRFRKLRFGQWRGAVWTDPETGVRWLCAAGLAKGEHEDHDDFYESLERLVGRGRGQTLLPTEEDRQLLKRETATWLMTEWELRIQSMVVRALSGMQPPASERFTVPHPVRAENVAVVEICFSTDDPQIEDYVVEIDWLGSYHSTNLGLVLMRRVLTSVAPRAQEWDRYAWTYSQIAEAGHRETRIEQLIQACADETLLSHEPGSVSHYGHRPHLAKSAVDGVGVRALCGTFFVITQDHTGKPVCPECETQFARLPR